MSNYHTNEVTRVDLATARVIGKPIKLPIAPRAIAANADWAWAAESSPDGPTRGRIVRINATKATVEQILSLDGSIVSVLADRAGSFWVATREPDGLLRLCASD